MHAPASAPPTVEPVLNEPAQGVMPVNADNLLTARRSASVTEDPSTFMTRVEVQAMLQRKKVKTSVASICLDLKHAYTAKARSKTYPTS